MDPCDSWYATKAALHYFIRNNILIFICLFMFFAYTDP